MHKEPRYNRIPVDEKDGIAFERRVELSVTLTLGEVLVKRER